MWIKTHPQPRPSPKPKVAWYDPGPPKWHYAKDVVNHDVYTACGLKLNTILIARTDMRDTKPKTALLCKKCKNQDSM